MSARETAEPLVLFVKLSVVIALLGITAGLAVIYGPRSESPTDDLPDRATETPTACPYSQPIGSDGTCGLTYDDIRESETHTQAP